MGHPRLRSNKPFPHHRCTRHQHSAHRCTPHCPPSQRGQGPIYSHLHPRPLPDLPAGAQAAHIIPGLASHSLLSAVTMNAGCTVTFTKINCTIVYCGRTIVCGHKCTKTGLWMVPLKCSDAQATAPPAVANEHTHPTAEPTMAIAANVDATSSAAEYARYIHQCMLSTISNTPWSTHTQ